MATLIDLKAACELLTALRVKLANRRAKVVFLEGEEQKALAQIATITGQLDAPSLAALPATPAEP